MAKTQTILKVFVASPIDVDDERKILQDVISEFNITWGDTHKVRLELIKWETNTRPGSGEDAQDVINQQIGDEYDIFLGIMWGRFGSQTNRAESGTEEEFERAYARLTESPGTVQIMFYFKDAGISPSKLDLEQLAKVQAFKHRISSEYGCLYHEFETTEQFQTKVRIHLSKLVQDLLKNNSAMATTKTSYTPLRTEKAFDPLANLTTLTDDEDEGLIELAERAGNAMESLVNVVNRMGEAINEVGAKFRQRTKEVKELTVGDTMLDMKAAKRVSNNSANDLEIYVQRMSVEIPEFHKQHSTSMDTFGKIAMISANDLHEDPDEIRNTLEQIQEYRSGITTASDRMAEFRKTVAGLPRMTTAFNRARKRAVAVMDDLLVQLRNAEGQSGDVEELLNRILETQNDSSQ